MLFLVEWTPPSGCLGRIELATECVARIYMDEHGLFLWKGYIYRNGWHGDQYGYLETCPLVMYRIDHWIARATLNLGNYLRHLCPTFLMKTPAKGNEIRKFTGIHLRAHNNSEMSVVSF